MDGPIPDAVLQDASEESDDEWLDNPVAVDPHEDMNHNLAREVVAHVQGEQVIKKRGREASSCWEHLNNQVYSNHDVQSRCQSCHCMVKHHKKSEKAISHLNKCNGFRQSMADVCSSDLPSWFVSRGRFSKNNKNKKNHSASVSSYASASSSSPFRPNDIRMFTIPVLSARDRAEFHSIIAMHYYMTGMSFARIEESHFIQALRVLRPDVTLPSRKDLAGKFLNKAYDQVHEKVDSWLNRNTYSCLTSDSWTNIKNEAVVNYMLVSEEMSLFLESHSTQEIAHTAQFTCFDMSRVIDKTPGFIAGGTMDNTAANKAAWVLLKAAYPDMFFQGCVAHGLHLLVKNIFAATKAKHGREFADYPTGYPFEHLLVFAGKVKDVVKFFNNHQAPKAILRRALATAKLNWLVQMAPTRWGSIKDMFVSVRAAEIAIHAVVTARGFIIGTAKQKDERRAIVDIVTNVSFLTLLDKAIMILNPIDAAIVFYQSDKVPVSEVYCTFNHKLPLAFRAMDIPLAERNYILNLVKDRYLFMEGDSHAISYLLDPRYLGSGMTPERRIHVEELIFNQPISRSQPSTAKSQEDLFSDFTNFRIAAQEMKNQNTIVYRMVMERKVSVLKFWLSRGDVWPHLQQLAKKIFGLVASSAASERNFSTFGFIHSKLRNSLSAAAVEKLVYIKTNNLQFTNQNHLRDDDDEFNEDDGSAQVFENEDRDHEDYAKAMD